MSYIRFSEYIDVSADDWFEDASEEEIKEMHKICDDFLKKGIINKPTVAELEFIKKMDKVKMDFYKINEENLKFLNEVLDKL